MAEKVTWMKLTAFLDTEKNFSKVKKALCSIPQIRDQNFDEKNNTVIIKVVCCSPEKIMNKLCSKGRGAIRRIETIDPPKCDAQKAKETLEKAKEVAEKVKEKPKESDKPKEGQKPKEGEKPKEGQSSQSATVMQTPMMGQLMYNGPYYYPPQDYGYVSRPIYDSYNGGGPPQPNHPYYGRSAFDHFSEDNPQGCFIM